MSFAFSNRIIRPVFAALAVSTLANCADVRQSMTNAGRYIDRTLGTDQQQDADAQAAEAFYRQARSARGKDISAYGSYLEQAAQNGHAAAAFELSEAYAAGQGRPQDLDQAAVWMNRAAERGDARAQYVVGAAYYAGNGVPQNDERATTFLAASAMQGDARAQYLLGEAFSNGRGVARDARWAARWYGKAAEQGHAQAQFAYGVAWGTALGLPRDDEASYLWLASAAARGVSDAARVRDAVGKRLSETKREAVSAKAKAFSPRRGPMFGDEPTIRYAQMTLNELGYAAGPADGRLGAQTRSAILSFKTAQKLSADNALDAAFVERLVERSRVRGN